MQSIAWWILNTKKENRFLAADVPLDLIPISIRRGRNNESSIREALVGSIIEPTRESSVIEKKGGRYYYFPHKSYLEFLVAEHFSHSTFSLDLYRDFIRNLNPEILSFIAEGHHQGRENLRAGLNRMLGSVDWAFIQACSQYPDVAAELGQPQSYNSPSDIYVHYAHLDHLGRDVTQFLSIRLSQANSVHKLATVLNLICHHLRKSPNSELARSLIINCINSFPERVLSTGSSIAIYDGDVRGLRGAVLAKCISWNGKAAQARLDLTSLEVLSSAAVGKSLFVSMPIEPGARKSAFVSKKIIIGSLIGGGRNLAENLFNSGKGNMPAIQLLGEAADQFRL